MEGGDTGGTDPTERLLGVIELDRDLQWCGVIVDDAAGREVMDIDLDDPGGGGTAIKLSERADTGESHY